MDSIEKFLNSVHEYYDESQIMHSYSVNTDKDNSVISNNDDLKYNIEKRTEKIAVSLLEKTKSMLQEKKMLDPWEKELLNRCIKVTDDSSSQPLTGKFMALAFGLGKLINLTCFLYERYELSGEDKRTMDTIEEYALRKMPDYNRSIIEDIVQMAYVYFRPDEDMVLDALNQLTQAAEEAGEYRRADPNFSMADAGVLLSAAEYAYTGISDSTYLIPLGRNEIPDEIGNSQMYNPSNGLFEITGGMKVLFCKWGNKIVIGFAGTEIFSKIATLGADIQQILSPNLMYLRGVGIINMMCRFIENEYDIIVVGHSLGGGLAQLAILANCREFPALRGAAFNSAGLSLQTLHEAGVYNAIADAADKITHYRALYDPVSAYGALVGHIENLATATFPWHCISNIKNCFIQ